MNTEKGFPDCKKLHRSFDELLALFIYRTGKIPSKTTLTEMLEWLFEQMSYRYEEMD